MLDMSQPEIQFAVEAVRQSCALAQSVQKGMQVEGIAKGDLSPVTVADFAVQALIGKGFQEHLSGATLVGEESSAMLQNAEGEGTLERIVEFITPFAAGASNTAVCDWIDQGAGDPGDRYWTLDPIDGTKGYLRGEQYAIALGLVENGQVQLGILGCPNLGEDCAPDMGAGIVAVAQRGHGAWCSTGGGEFKPLKVSERTDPSQARLLRSVESGHTNVGEIDYIAERLGVEAEPVRLDSQAKYAVLAAGGAEMLLRLLSPKYPDYKECIWDQAAGSIVLEEAGGRITDLKGNALDFGHGRKLLQNTGVFASNGHLHDVGLEAIQAVCTLPE